MAAQTFVDMWGRKHNVPAGMVLAGDGFPRRARNLHVNTAKPCKRPDRLAKLRAKLDARIKAWEDTTKSNPRPRHDHHKPGSLK